MSKKATAPSAEAGAAAPATPATPVPARKDNPLHQPTPPRPRDAFTGVGGTYTRDPTTGERTRVEPAAPPAADEDTAAA